MSEDEEDQQTIERRRREGYGLMVALGGLMFTFLIQFGGSIWWGATLSADLRHVTETLARMESERYTKADAARDMQRLDQTDGALRDRVSELQVRITRLEDKK